jgi:hypothetical protein
VPFVNHDGTSEQVVAHLSAAIKPERRERDE